MAFFGGNFPRTRRGFWRRGMAAFGGKRAWGIRAARGFRHGRSRGETGAASAAFGWRRGVGAGAGEWAWRQRRSDGGRGVVAFAEKRARGISPAWRFRHGRFRRGTGVAHSRGVGFLAWRSAPGKRGRGIRRTWRFPRGRLRGGTAARHSGGRLRRRGGMGFSAWRSPAAERNRAARGRRGGRAFPGGGVGAGVRRARLPHSSEPEGWRVTVPPYGERRSPRGNRPPQAIPLAKPDHGWILLQCNGLQRGACRPKAFWARFYRGRNFRRAAPFRERRGDRITL